MAITSEMLSTVGEGERTHWSSNIEGDACA